MVKEDKQSQNYFERSRNVWFPDFVEKVEDAQRRYQRTSFHGMLTLLCYFRSEITRQQFLVQFFAQEAPEKLLPSDRKKYSQIKSLCTAYQNKEISGTELDEKMLLCFRARPTEDVFMPAFESWNEINDLISRLETKMERLPIYFDGLAWGGYLKGIVTSRQYAEAHLAFDTAGYLAQLRTYGVDSVKESLAEEYTMEVSVCLRLQKLCLDYKNELLCPNAFETQFLQLAREFCSDIKE